MDGERELGKEAIRNVIKWRNESMGIPAGKMFVQKILFMSKRLGENIPYEFSLYTYGPFSREIMDDLDELEENKEIEIKWNDRFEGYEIHDEGIVLNESVTFQTLKNVLDEQGHRNAKQLELMSTLIFLRKDIVEDELMSAVKRVKPFFEDDQISEMINLTREIYGG